jgi:hypothetical protein
MLVYLYGKLPQQRGRGESGGEYRTNHMAGVDERPSYMVLQRPWFHGPGQKSLATQAGCGVFGGMRQGSGSPRARDDVVRGGPHHHAITLRCR